uniref:SKP1-like protein 1B n=1 Tax=Rhizophora mucronata TaxID=61149 RepID=A0A2P2IW85_RHIMU
MAIQLGSIRNQNASISFIVRLRKIKGNTTSFAVELLSTTSSLLYQSKIKPAKVLYLLHTIHGNLVVKGIQSSASRTHARATQILARPQNHPYSQHPVDRKNQVLLQSS